jgi:hypothetical protein
VGQRGRFEVPRVTAILWVGLVLILILTTLLCAWALVRAFVRLLAAIGELLVKPAILDGVHRAEPEARPMPAVLEPRAVVAARYHELAASRQLRGEYRHLARLDRARALLSSEPKALN